MKFVPVNGIPKLNSTPLAALTIESPCVAVEVDDKEENRVRILFLPYQAIKITTTDCYIPPRNLSVIPRVVVEVVNSPWLDELRANLFRIDEAAKFMDKARHFLLPLQDDFLEIAAWEITLEQVEVAK